MMQLVRGEIRSMDTCEDGTLGRWVAELQCSPGPIGGTSAREWSKECASSPARHQW